MRSNGKVFTLGLYLFAFGLWIFSAMFFYLAVIHNSAALVLVEAGCMLGAIVMQVVAENIRAASL